MPVTHEARCAQEERTVHEELPAAPAVSRRRGASWGAIFLALTAALPPAEAGNIPNALYGPVLAPTTPRKTELKRPAQERGSPRRHRGRAHLEGKDGSVHGTFQRLNGLGS